MSVFHDVLILLIATTFLGVITRWFPWPWPITYVIGGCLLSFIPRVPAVALDPGFFFVFFLPPLLYSDGWLISLRDLARVKRSVIILSVALVAFTTVAIGYTAHWLIPGLSLAMALALGAVVSPTDAVAVSAITERLDVPARITTILKGESLMNDATGLVAFKFALLAAAAGTVSLRAVTWEFLYLSIGGLGVGLLLAILFGLARDLLKYVRGSDALIEVTASLVTPYLVYVIAESLDVSPILAVVAAGLYGGWRDPLKMTGETRQFTFAVWRTALFWLNGLVFVLLGLQLPRLLSLVQGHYTPYQLFLYITVVSAVAIISRIAWFFPGSYLPFILFRHIRTTEVRPPWQWVLVGGWAGMRGSVTLAAALSIPMVLPDGTAFPSRDIVIFLAFGVILVSLLLQGTTLETLIRKLGVRADATRTTEDNLARVAAIQAGLKVLRAFDTGTLRLEESASLKLTIAEYEQRLSELISEGEIKENARRGQQASHQYSLLALTAERAAINDLWRRGIIADETHRPLQVLIDHAEAKIGTQTALSV